MAAKATNSKALPPTHIPFHGLPPRYNALPPRYNALPTHSALPPTHSALHRLPPRYNALPTHSALPPTHIPFHGLPSRYNTLPTHSALPPTHIPFHRLPPAPVPVPVQDPRSRPKQIFLPLIQVPGRELAHHAQEPGQKKMKDIIEALPSFRDTNDHAAIVKELKDARAVNKYLIRRPSVGNGYTLAYLKATHLNNGGSSKIAIYIREPDNTICFDTVCFNSIEDLASRLSADLKPFDNNKKQNAVAPGNAAAAQGGKGSKRSKHSKRTKYSKKIAKKRHTRKRRN